MIQGETIERPTKKMLSASISAELGFEPPEVSSGSSVDSAVLDKIHEALTGGPSDASDTLRKTERVLEVLGLTYDPFWDTSESAPKPGGTVTARAFSRILTAVTGVPRCFIVNSSDAEAGAKWESGRDEVYRYASRISGQHSLNDAGPGTRIIHYSTKKSSTHPKHFVSCAVVHYVSPGWTGPWEARLSGFTEFPRPISVDDFEMSGWNRRNSITEISWDTYKRLLKEGGIDPEVLLIGREEDPGGDITAERVVRNFPVEELDLALQVPDALPPGVIKPSDPIEPTYSESEDGSKMKGPKGFPQRSRSDRKRDKLAEARAIELTQSALGDQGWTLERDCQDDGIGYDLRFMKDGKVLKVEVKGIQGRKLEFNLTPKESWRAETDPDWVIVAVTGVLSPRVLKMSLLTRDQVASADRVVTSFRITLD